MLRPSAPTLQDRILKSASLPLHCSFLAAGRPSHYKDWSDDRLYAAFQAVQKGQSVRQAAESYAVPKSTLYDRVSGKVVFGTRSGPPKYLTDDFF